MNASSGNIAVEFKNITKKYKFVTAVKDLSLKIYENECVGFLGPNGAGKTTLIKLLANLIKPTEGEIFISDSSLSGRKDKNLRKLQNNLGFLIDIPYFYQESTAEQILTYFAKLKDYPRDRIPARVDKVLEQVDMKRWKKEKLKTFSKGMTQKIGIASAIVHDPKIIVLDEPQTGLDPMARVQVRDILKELNEQGKTLFVSSHLVREISEITTKLALIFKGTLLAYDSLENLEGYLKGNEVDFELLEPLDVDVYKRIIPQIDEIIKPYCGESVSKLTGLRVQYIPQSNAIKVFFDGEKSSRYEIIKIMANFPEIKIISAYTDETERLEKLYIDIMQNASANPEHRDIEIRRMF
ncbi:MAG: ABC transporter ATP-binding protein [archaeon]|nr:ABC transporter ATP-binding protein [archaeon]